jgi:transcriptional regulator with XRE-family HTH domain
VAAEQTGTLLWEMRTAGGWTLGRLAQQAGVSKMALSRWEAGTRQPRIPELEAVLKALNANAAQKARIFATINAPRAIQHLRTAMTDAGMGDMPSAGDLLRAMRLRQGWTQGQTAAALHVTQATVARWEKGERLPDNTQVHTLCYVLGAKEEELLALTTGQFTDTPAVEPANSSAAYEELTAVFESGIERGKRFVLSPAGTQNAAPCRSQRKNPPSAGADLRGARSVSSQWRTRRGSRADSPSRFADCFSPRW